MSEFIKRDVNMNQMLSHNIDLQVGRVCKNCGHPASEHSSANICPRFYTQEDLDKGIDPSGKDTTWWK